MNHNILTKSIDSKLSQLRLIDDDLFAVAFDGRKEETGIILNTILGRNDIHVESVKTQYEIHNIEGRSVKLDVFATDELGKQFNIEIQRDAYYAHPKRARYHASMMDTNTVRKGTDFKDLPENYVIFITEEDVFKITSSLCHIERVILETDDQFADEQHIIYVTAAIDDHSPFSQLMHDFLVTDYHNMSNKNLAELLKYYKTNKKGRDTMSNIMREFGLEQREEERNLIINTLLKKGLSPNYISSLLEMPIKKILKLRETNKNE